MSRFATRQRTTKETSIEVSIEIDGSGTAQVGTGLPFFDHMLEQVGKHGGFDLRVSATGDLAVDSHHTVEDVGIALGEVFREALGDKAGVRRFASGLFPLDAVSYTHLRAHETVLDLVCRLLLEKKNTKKKKKKIHTQTHQTKSLQKHRHLVLYKPQYK